MSGSFKDKLSWFASELLVIVVGVLVALALNSSWQRILDRETEAAFLDQVSDELRSSIRVLENDSLITARSRHAVVKVIRSYRLPVQPPMDSLASWLNRSFGFAINTVSLGSLEALVSSDDIQLIRSDALRARFPVFLSEAKTLNDGLIMMVDAHMRNFEHTNRMIDRPGLSQMLLPDSTRTRLAGRSDLYWLPPDAEEVWIGQSIQELVRSEDLYSSFTLLNAHLGAMAGYRNSALRIARDLVVQIEEER